MLHRKSHPNNVDVTGSFEHCSRAVKLYTTRIDGNKADIDVIYTPRAHVKLPESRSWALPYNNNQLRIVIGLFKTVKWFLGINTYQSSKIITAEWRARVDQFMCRVLCWGYYLERPNLPVRIIAMCHHVTSGCLDYYKELYFNRMF